MTGWDNADNNTLDAPAAAAPTAEPGRVSLTLKSDGTYDGPWYVIHGANAQDVLDQLTDPALTQLLQAATNVSTNWSTHHMATKGLTPVSSQPASNAVATPAAAPATQPGGPAPTCEHGPRVWKDFTSKAGNHVKGWFCQTRNSDCKPMFAK